MIKARQRLNEKYRKLPYLIFLLLTLPFFVFGNKREFNFLNDSFLASCLNHSDSVFFNGYYIVLFTKKEIKEIRKNRFRRLHGKSFQASVDFRPVKYFISKEEVKEKGFYRIVKDLPLRNKDKLYYECDLDYGNIFYKPFKMKKEDFKCSWPPFSNGNKFYTTLQKSKYCFKIYEVSCWFLTLKIDTEEKREIMDRNIGFLKPGLKEFDAYFFAGYKDYSNEPLSLGSHIRVWREQPSVFD